eukprot:4814646-Prymnesium_polylepis.1
MERHVGMRHQVELLVGGRVRIMSLPRPPKGWMPRCSEELRAKPVVEHPRQNGDILKRWRCAGTYAKQVALEPCAGPYAGFGFKKMPIAGRAGESHRAQAAPDA